MNPFINPSRRSVSLPHGCKDLIDVLRVRDRKVTSFGREVTVKPERFENEGLKRLDLYVTKFLAASATAGVSLYIRSLDGQNVVVLSRSLKEFAIYPVVGLIEREQAVERFFLLRSTKPSIDFLIGHPGSPTRILGFPLPSAGSDVAHLTIDLMREVYGFTDESGIEFIVVERGEL